jgi:uroporphyrinogen-III synthase
MRILLTRAKADAERTAARLEALGHRIIISPVIDIIATGASLPDEPFEAVIATSAHAFTGDTQPLTHIPLYAVGERTREAAERADWTAPIVVRENAETLIALLRRESHGLSRVIYLAGRDRKPDIEAAAKEIGFDLAVIEAYIAHAVSSLSQQAEHALREHELDAVLHYSRRGAELFIAMTQRAELWPQARQLRHFAVSQDIAEPLIAAGAQTRIAPRPDEDHLLAALSQRP